MQSEDLFPRRNRYIPIVPTPKQAAFLLLPHKEAFYGGAAGGGKSVSLLGAGLQYADVPGYAALLVRRSYMELMQPNGLIDLSKKWLGATDAVWRESDYTWRFPSGATLTFRYLQGASSELAFQGGEYQFIGIDEVTEIEEDAYRFLFSRLRNKAGSQIPLRMRAASNPYGPGAEWVYRRFILEGPSERQARRAHLSPPSEQLRLRGRGARSVPRLGLDPDCLRAALASVLRDRDRARLRRPGPVAMGVLHGRASQEAREETCKLKGCFRG